MAVERQAALPVVARASRRLLLKEVIDGAAKFSKLRAAGNTQPQLPKRCKRTQKTGFLMISVFSARRLAPSPSLALASFEQRQLGQHTGTWEVVVYGRPLQPLPRGAPIVQTRPTVPKPYWAQTVS